MIKIVSWNVNGYRSITGQNPSKNFDKVVKDNRLFEYIEKENPDIICLQETKAEREQINLELQAPEGYEAYYHSCRRKKGYSGVVTFSKIKAKEVVNEFSIEKFDNEGRFVLTDYDDFALMNIYFPNGTSGQDRIDYKLEFYDALFEYCENLKKSGKELIICGDYNTAHKEIDLARPKENVNTSGFLPEERVKLDWMVENGYTDCFRMFNQEANNYTWWSARARAKENNVGWRIDYHFVTDGLVSKVKNHYHQSEQLGSDHCPIVLELDV